MDNKVLLAHGSGGKLSHDLIKNHLFPVLANPILERMDDSAVFDINSRVAFTTDSFVVNPIFFPGGDIGKLAVCGTVNDLSMMGAQPTFLSLAFILEEGLAFDELDKIMDSIRRAAEESGVKIVTGDTKIVEHGKADKVYINTSGIGLVPQGVDISGANARPGDKIILSGSLGDHGIAVLAQRQSLRLKVPVESDCAPLNAMVKEILQFKQGIRSMRDPTRGGLATTLNEMAEQSQCSFRIYEDKIPVKESVNAACNMLGLDPLYIANEGKMVVIAAPGKAEEIAALMRKNIYGRDSVIIGEVLEGHPGRVVIKNRLGTSRVIEMLNGELLPRIC
jgi:hydrogenase expression/formation protein HypE